MINHVIDLIILKSLSTTIKNIRLYCLAYLSTLLTYSNL